jgi:hypothetical protein
MTAIKRSPLLGNALALTGIAEDFAGAYFLPTKTIFSVENYH